jgi:Ca2+/Na+ antiporter
VAEEEIELAPAIHPVPAGRGDGLVAAISVAVVIAASAVMERSGEVLGRTFHLSPLVVGAIVLAAVTSLPNAVGAIYLARRGRGSAVLSEAMNSNMLNVVVGLLLPGIFFGVAAGGGGVLVAAWSGALTSASLAIAYAFRGIPWRWGIVVVAGYAAFVPVVVTR